MFPVAGIALPIVICCVLADLPFFPRPPLYTQHIAQLVLGVVCLRLSLMKEPLIDRSGQVILNRGLVKILLLTLGAVALLSSVVGFVLYWREHFS